MNLNKIKKIFEPSKEKVLFTLGIFLGFTLIFSLILSVLGEPIRISGPLSMYIEEVVCTGFICTGPEINIDYTILNLVLWYIATSVGLEYRRKDN